MTVLFKSDFYNSEGQQISYIDTETSNESFKRIAILYKRMGIENYLFPLALYDKDLIGYDPHNPTDNSEELKHKCAIESKINYWYFIREVAKISAQGTSEGSRYIANRGNISMSWSILTGTGYILIMARQNGKTISALIMSTWQLYISGINLSLGMITRNRKLLVENVSRVKKMRDLLPQWMIHYTTKDVENKEGLVYKQLDNEYETYVGLSDREGAASIGRGSTFTSFHFDEASYIKNIDVTHSVILPTQIEGSKNARLNGMIYSNVYTTTPAPLSFKSGMFVYKLIQNSMKFSETLYDLKNKYELRKIINKNSITGLLSGTFSFLQLGRDYQWFVETTKRMQATEDEIDREFRNIWKFDSEYSILNKELILKLNEHIQEPKYLEILENDYVLKWYISEVEIPSYRNKSFIIAMDSSENIGKDFSTLLFLDPSNLEVIATLRCNESNIIMFSKIIADFLTEYPKAVLIPERKSTGAAIIDFLIQYLTVRHIDPIKRIYNTVYQDGISNINTNDLSNSVLRKRIGFSTTKERRNMLFKRLVKAVKMNYKKIYDEDLIKEITSLSVINGRIDHTQDGNDDMVIAYLLANWFIFEGNNLDKYGLNITKIKKEIIYTEDEIDSQKQKLLLDKVVHLKALAKSTDSDILKEYYTKKVDIINEELSEYDIKSEPISLAVNKEKVETIDYEKVPDYFV